MKNTTIDELPKLPVLKRLADMPLTDDEREYIHDTLAPLTLVAAARYTPEELIVVNGYIYKVDIVEEALEEMS
jgi:hypothetical protein